MERSAEARAEKKGLSLSGTGREKEKKRRSLHAAALADRLSSFPLPRVFPLQLWKRPAAAHLLVLLLVGEVDDGPRDRDGQTEGEEVEAALAGVGGRALSHRGVIGGSGIGRSIDCQGRGGRRAQEKRRECRGKARGGW